MPAHCFEKDATWAEGSPSGSPRALLSAQAAGRIQLFAEAHHISLGHHITTFLMLWPFQTVHVVMTPNHEIIFVITS